jgi:hypothetical protein
MVQNINSQTFYTCLTEVRSLIDIEKSCGPSQGSGSPREATAGCLFPEAGEKVTPHGSRQSKHTVGPASENSYFTARMAGRKAPALWDFAAGFPRTPKGKIQKFALASMIEAGRPRADKLDRSP